MNAEDAAEPMKAHIGVVMNAVRSVWREFLLATGAALKDKADGWDLFYFRPPKVFRAFEI